MKIIVPVNNRENSSINNSLGRAAYFLLIDGEKRTFIDNEATKFTGAAGIKSAETIVNSGANVLITKRCGTKAAGVLEESNIEIFKAVGDNIDENISKYKNNLLEILEERENK